MELNEYQDRVFELNMFKGNTAYRFLKLVEEVGEAVQLFNKHPMGMELNQLMLLELGDILFQVSALADEFSFSLERVAQENIAKLRYRDEMNSLRDS